MGVCMCLLAQSGMGRMHFAFQIGHDWALCPYACSLRPADPCFQTLGERSKKVITVDRSMLRLPAPPWYGRLAHAAGQPPSPDWKELFVGEATGTEESDITVLTTLSNPSSISGSSPPHKSSSAGLACHKFAQTWSNPTPERRFLQCTDVFAQRSAVQGLQQTLFTTTIQCIPVLQCSTPVSRDNLLQAPPSCCARKRPEEWPPESRLPLLPCRWPPPLWPRRWRLCRRPSRWLLLPLRPALPALRLLYPKGNSRRPSPSPSSLSGPRAKPWRISPEPRRCEASK